MGRGLDGFFDFLPNLARLCSCQGPRRAGLHQFPVVIARGKHLFPFRTEQLSLSAPMVLGPQGPGRVGRRRFLVTSGVPPQRGARCSFWRGCGAWRAVLRSPGRRATGGKGVTHTCAGAGTAPPRRGRAGLASGAACGCALALAPGSGASMSSSTSPSARPAAERRAASPRATGRAVMAGRGSDVGRKNMCSYGRGGGGRIAGTTPRASARRRRCPESLGRWRPGLQRILRRGRTRRWCRARTRRRVSCGRERRRRP